jgi:predicted nucleotidyltransferase component of viral defense system
VITEGLLLRHCQGQQMFRDGALIDVAQDQALHLIHEAGLFDLDLVFKGGTALRKFRLGSAGRFSTDLDFAVSEQGLAELVLERLDGASIDGFTFRVEPLVEARRALLHIESNLGSPRIPARIDIAQELPWIPAETIAPIPMPIHRAYGFSLRATPVITIEELLSEKLARYRRDSLARDLYDLAWFSSRAFDEALVRRLTVLKVWRDINVTGLGRAPFDPENILRPRARNEFREEAIGFLTSPVEIEKWVEAVRKRYAFLRDVDDVERGLLAANPRDGWTVQNLIEAYRPAPPVS